MCDFSRSFWPTNYSEFLTNFYCRRHFPEICWSKIAPIQFWRSSIPPMKGHVGHKKVFNPSSNLRKMTSALKIHQFLPTFAWLRMVNPEFKSTNLSLHSTAARLNEQPKLPESQTIPPAWHTSLGFEILIRVSQNDQLQKWSRGGKMQKFRICTL